MVRKISFCILATFLSMNLYADEIASYTAIKYHVNYEKQKSQIVNFKEDSRYYFIYL